MQQAHIASARMIGVDVARFVAIIGMIAAHLVPMAGMLAEPGSAADIADSVTEMLTAGIAAPLFAVLGGVSAVFATRRLREQGHIAEAIVSVAVRGLLLIVIGLLLGFVQTPVIIVLVYYGVAMLLVAPFIAAPSWVLGGLAAVLSVIGGPVNIMLRPTAEAMLTGGWQITVGSLITDPLDTLCTVLLTGEYPALTWCVYLFVGMLIGRALTTAHAGETLGRTAGLLAMGGTALAVASQLVSRYVGVPMGARATGEDVSVFAEQVMQSSNGAPLSTELWAQLVATPHSGSPVDVFRTVGIAAAVIGLLVLVCDVWRERRGAPVGVVLGAVRAAGAAPLTVYTLHILSTGLLFAPMFASPEAFFEHGLGWWAEGLSAWGLQVAGVLVLGAVLAALGKRGPLEALVSRIVKLVGGSFHTDQVR